MMMSPALMPMRNSICISVGTSVFRGDHATLYRNGASHRMNHACKFHQHSVAGALLMIRLPCCSISGIEERGQMFVEPGVRTLLISTHKATVASHIGHENSTQSSFNPLCGHKSSPRSGPTFGT